MNGCCFAVQVFEGGRYSLILWISEKCLSGIQMKDLGPREELLIGPRKKQMKALEVSREGIQPTPRHKSKAKLLRLVHKMSQNMIENHRQLLFTHQPGRWPTRKRTSAMRSVLS